MIQLTPNTADQTIRLTLDEGRFLYSTAFTHYLLIITREENNNEGGQSLAQVVTVLAETERVTTIRITTVGLESSGRHRYEVYGQNSASNTDPEAASVVGLVERGRFDFTDSVDYFDMPTLTIPDDVYAS